MLHIDLSGDVCLIVISKRILFPSARLVVGILQRTCCLDLCDGGIRYRQQSLFADEVNVLQLQAHGSKAGNLPLLSLIGKNHPGQCKKQHCHTGQADDDIHNGGIFFLLFLLSSGRHTASGSGSTPLRVRVIARGIRLPVLNLLEILCIIGILIGSSRHSHIICIGVGHFSLKIKLIPDGGGSVIRVFPVGCICPLIGFLVIDFLAVGLPVIGLLTVGFPGVGLTGIGRLTAGLLNVRLIGIGFLCGFQKDSLPHL